MFREVYLAEVAASRRYGLLPFPRIQSARAFTTNSQEKKVLSNHRVECLLREFPIWHQEGPFLGMHGFHFLSEAFWENYYF